MFQLRIFTRRGLALAGCCLGACAVAAWGNDPHYALVNAETGIDATTSPSIDYPPNQAEMAGSICVGDFNNDSWPDLFIQGLGVRPDMLYINQRDGTFADEAKVYGVARTHLGMGSAVGDVNNDGYPDLYVVSYGDTAAPDIGRCLLYINNGPDAKGGFSFTEEAQQRGVNEIMQVVAGKGAALGDMDLDGDLDLFVATWVYEPGGGGNRIFENDGTGRFTDVSDMVLPTLDEVMRGFTPKLVDVTGDRYPDLLLTCDFSTSRLLVNNGPDAKGHISFRDTTEISGITTDHNGMGSAVNDFNADGLLDWFQTNIYVSSVNYTNTLFMGMGNDENGDPLFQDQAIERGVADAGWGWGVVSGDYDNDGDLDLIATNGWPSWPGTPTRCWINDGQADFTDQAQGAGLDFTINGRGMVHFDYDNDGDLDLAFVENDGPVRIYKNGLNPSGDNNYLRISLNTDAHPCLAPMGYGTRAIATYAGRDHLRVVDGASSYLGQSELIIHFGLGDLESVDSLRVEWADGSVTTMTDVPADQQIIVNAYHPLDLSRDGQLNFFDVSMLIQAYIARDDAADFNDDGSVNTMDIMGYLARYAQPCP